MRILLAHDGSDGANGAAELVRAITWPAGSTLRVVSVVEPTMVALTAWAGGIADESAEAEGQVREYYEGELDETVRRLAGPDRSVESAVLRGRPATAIVEDARAFGADLVVVGSRGLGPVSSVLMGSVSRWLVKHADVPVTIVTSHDDREPAAV